MMSTKEGGRVVPGAEISECHSLSSTSLLLSVNSPVFLFSKNFKKIVRCIYVRVYRCLSSLTGVNVELIA